jgi:hypothetical protein
LFGSGLVESGFEKWRQKEKKGPYRPVVLDVEDLPSVTNSILYSLPSAPSLIHVVFLPLEVLAQKWNGKCCGKV